MSLYKYSSHILFRTLLFGICNLKQIQSALLLKIDIRAAVHAQWRSRNKSSMNNVHSREKRYWEEFNNSVIEMRARKRRNLYCKWEIKGNKYTKYFLTRTFSSSLERKIYEQIIQCLPFTSFTLCPYNKVWSFIKIFLIKLYQQLYFLRYCT